MPVKDKEIKECALDGSECQTPDGKCHKTGKGFFLDTDLVSCTKTKQSAKDDEFSWDGASSVLKGALNALLIEISPQQPLISPRMYHRRCAAAEDSQAVPEVHPNAAEVPGLGLQARAARAPIRGPGGAGVPRHQG